MTAPAPSTLPRDRFRSDRPPVAGPDDEAARDDASLPARDLTVDLLRAIAIAAVAVGHWLVVVPSYADGRFDGVNALATVPAMRPLTWLFQVMPLFFVVGGVANAASWERARRAGDRYGDWLRTRLERLVVPAAVMVAAGAAAAAGLRAGGVAGDVVEPIAWLITVPVWFLAVYVLVVAVAPVGWWAHRRWGTTRVVVTLTAASAAVDALRLTGGAWAEAVAAVSFLLVFGVAQHLGFAWYDGRLLRARGTGWALLGVGLGALVALTTVGPYPVSLVGYPGVEVENNAPPTITLIALGLAQTGAALLLRPRLARALERRSVQAFALVLNGNAMTVLLWHFVALVLASVVALPLGLVPVHPDGSAAWWLTRVVWVLLLAVVTVPIVAVAGRVERRPVAVTGRGEERPVGFVLLAVPVLSWAFVRITLDGLSVADGPWGIPVATLALLGVGAWLIGSPAPRPVGVGSFRSRSDAHRGSAP